MIAAAVEERNEKAERYLLLLRSLATELEKAMRAIALNRLSDFEESIVTQQALSNTLASLVGELCVSMEATPAAFRRCGEDEQMRQIVVASEALQTLNARYAALLKHSSHSVNLMASLFASFRGQFQETSGPRLRDQRWSGQMETSWQA